MVERRLAAILSADVAGYTRLMRADEEGTLARLRAHRAELIEPKIGEHKGRIVKLMGDGVLVEFASIVDAVRCATEIQRGMAARNGGAPEDERMLLRIGINLGDVIVEGDDIHGDGVNVATRMQEIAPQGGVSVSGVVYDSVRDKLAPGFEDLGPQRIKNIAEPVRAYRVVLDPEAAGARAPEQAAAPRQGAAVSREAGADVAKRLLLTVLSGAQRQGRWRVPRTLHVVTLMAGVDLDFRDAVLGPGLTEIKVTALMGAVAIVVPPDLQVECGGVGVLGVFEGMVGEGDPDPAAPRLRITGVAVMGALEISIRPSGSR